MRNTLLALILTLPTLCFSQVDWREAKVTYGAENETLPNLADTVREYYSETANLKRLKFRDSTKLTIIEFDTKNNKITSTIFPLDNLKYKTLTKYNGAGLIVLVASYDHGIVTGKFQKYFDNGKLMQEGAYDKMKKVGEWRYYNEQGKLVKTENH